MSETQRPSRADAVEDFLPSHYPLAVEHGKTSMVPDISSCLRMVEVLTSSSTPLGRSAVFVLAPDSWQNYPTTARAVRACLTGQPGGSCPKKRNAGRPPEYRDAIYEALGEEFEQRGDLQEDKQGWSRQAHAEKAVLDRLGDKGLHPAESTVRIYVSTFLAGREKMNMKADYRPTLSSASLRSSLRTCVQYERGCILA
jgi:hypothetical protein